jgi:Fe-S-cluster containining protein
VVFTCKQCGTCCMHLGDYITIEKQIGPFEFMGCCVSTGTRFHARIDSDKHELFLDQSWIRYHTSACPFLRPSDGRIVCTIHETSPVQCKMYRCVIYLVSTRKGEVIGRVTGTLNLHSEDPELLRAWSTIQSEIDRIPVEAKEGEIKRLLEGRGYRCA